jgi:hypothetical protein
MAMNGNISTGGLTVPDQSDRLSRLASDESISYAQSDECDTTIITKEHRTVDGYKICQHTCVTTTCISPKTGSILWLREGHALWKHACNTKMHRNCGRGIHANCPARQCIGQDCSKLGARVATEEEVALHLDQGPDAVEVPQEEVVDEMGVVSFDISAPLAPHPTIARTSPMSVDRRFKLVYVPEAAMRICSQVQAQNDLAFIPAVLT